MTEIIIKGTIPADPRQRVLVMEAAAEAICRSVGEDPADAVMVLLTAAVHMSTKHSGKPVADVMETLAGALGAAIVAADDFFKLKPAA